MDFTKKQVTFAMCTAAILAPVLTFFANKGLAVFEKESALRAAQKECFEKAGVQNFKGFKFDAKANTATLITEDKSAGNMTTIYNATTGLVLEHSRENMKEIARPYTMQDFANGFYATQECRM